MTDEGKYNALNKCLTELKDDVKLIKDSMEKQEMSRKAEKDEIIKKMEKLEKAKTVSASDDSNFMQVN